MITEKFSQLITLKLNITIGHELKKKLQILQLQKERKNANSFYSILALLLHASCAEKYIHSNPPPQHR